MEALSIIDLYCSLTLQAQVNYKKCAQCSTGLDEWSLMKKWLNEAIQLRLFDVPLENNLIDAHEFHGLRIFMQKWQVALLHINYLA